MQDNITNEVTTEKHLKPTDEPSLKKGSKKRVASVIIGATLLTALGLYGIHSAVKPNKTESSQSKSGRRQGIPVVTVATATQKTVPVQLQQIGNVTAESTVSVTPQVSGTLIGVFFKKGQEVNKGQLLFTIDPRTQQAAIQQAKGTLAKDLAQVQQNRATLAKDLTAIKQAQANLAKDQAQAKYAQAQAKRYTDLLASGAVSADTAQQYTTNKATSTATILADRQAIANAQAAIKVDQAQIQNAQGVVKSDQGTLENAQVQLSYTNIYSPINGRAGNTLVTLGNVVQANSTTALLTISQIHPIQVSFSVPEANLPTIQQYMQNNKLAVYASFPNSNTTPEKGVLYSVNNAVDTTTGTIQLIAEFQNPQGRLWPGQYVNTTLQLTTEPNATVVPSQAVENGPSGQFVFVLKPDMTVQNVPVTVSNTVGGLAVIKTGIQPGTKVITDGQANLISGNKVQLKGARQAGGEAGQGQQTGRRHRGNDNNS